MAKPVQDALPWGIRAGLSKVFVGALSRRSNGGRMLPCAANRLGRIAIEGTQPIAAGRQRRGGL